MPAYKKKITRRMEYEEFEEGIKEQNQRDQAFLSVLFFAGVRVSEAIALTPNDISCTPDFIFVTFRRLKGSKSTDPIPLPRNSYLNWLCQQDEKPFDFHRSTGWRIVKRVFPELYPHFYRQNRISWISEKKGDAHVYSWTGICAQSIDHYRANVDISTIGQALKEMSS